MGFEGRHLCARAWAGVLAACPRLLLRSLNNPPPPRCPTVAYQLAGAKKVQQVLASPSQLDRFLSPKEADAARQVFAGLWSLSGDDKPGPNAPPDEVEAARAMAAAMADPTGFVMKPQREGGGNNLFGEALTAALRQLTRAQRSAYILMQRIEPQVVQRARTRTRNPGAGRQRLPSLVMCLYPPSTFHCPSLLSPARPAGDSPCPPSPGRSQLATPRPWCSDALVQTPHLF